MSNQVELASKIAEEAHKGQFRHDGNTPYITHPLAVAKNFELPLNDLYSKKDRECYISAALLHDVIEDSDFTKQDLLDRGVDPYIANLVEVLTHKWSETYLNYILRVRVNYTACKIKIADIKHNLFTLDSKKKAQRDE